MAPHALIYCRAERIGEAIARYVCSLANTCQEFEVAGVSPQFPVEEFCLGFDRINGPPPKLLPPPKYVTDGAVVMLDQCEICEAITRLAAPRPTAYNYWRLVMATGKNGRSGQALAFPGNIFVRFRAINFRQRPNHDLSFHPELATIYFLP